MTAPSGSLSGPAASWETATLYSLPGEFWNQLHCLLRDEGPPHRRPERQDGEPRLGRADGGRGARAPPPTA